MKIIEQNETEIYIEITQEEAEKGINISSPASCQKMFVRVEKPDPKKSIGN